MYMSRLAAIKEFAFMKALKDHGFSVPEPISQNRHTIVMSMIDAFPLRQISSVPNPAGLYAELITTILELAKFGLIHGDYNEFNILIKEEEIPAEAKDDENKEKKEDNVKLTPVVIDFPQMVSVDHTNAEMYFDRDVNCIKRYFQRRFGFVSDEPGPFFSDARKLYSLNCIEGIHSTMASKIPKAIPKNLYKPLPVEQRKQIYLPDFVLTLIRTPFLPPRYASFWVPLTFNKLDMKDYMKRVYNVDVLKVRSYVEQQKVTRDLPRGRQGFGPMRRQMAKKKMTIEMTEPFVWPKEPEDYAPWERDTFFEAKKLQEEFQESHAHDAPMKAPEHKRELLAEQAKQMLDGKEQWQPTWQALGLNLQRPQLKKVESKANQPPQASETSQTSER
ncbi:RIO1 family protein kinase [Arthroderma uncinatum]|uniref:RIO1 family protein kinase n=1 Tax=Arthroderma uncinatum TaxID=74035 RepID=UPI00144AECB3|nr:RIO1 family protein kinase [Arthroderma uncinatum]KAF3483662.1 RIO1 family protein kinase [Arthroderma uncinatum]